MYMVIDLDLGINIFQSFQFLGHPLSDLIGLFKQVDRLAYDLIP